MINISTPTLLINEQIVKHNLAVMLEKARRSDVIFRPHFKTHQSEAVGEIFRSMGIDKITVSSVSMARFFAGCGWNDITIAFPFNILEMEAVNQLASQIQLNVLLESEAVARRFVSLLRFPVGVFVKIDTGYHRTGILPEETDKLDALIRMVSASGLVHFRGFLTHAGHTYHARSGDEIMRIKEKAVETLQQLKQRYKKQFPGLLLSYGDTPSCSLSHDCLGLDEIRPGNFVYYDVMQYHLGSCRLEDIAVVAACPVVAVHSRRKEVVIYGGSIHLSKEFIAADHGFQLFGYVVKLDNKGHWQSPIPGAYVAALSQEHGVVHIPESYLDRVKEGDILGVLPVHSCLTAHLISNQILV